MNTIYKENILYCKTTKKQNIKSMLETREKLKKKSTDNNNSDNTNNEFKIYDTPKLQKPFLKWIGGKTQIIDKLLAQMPYTFNNYHELFLGGGSVLISVLYLSKIGMLQIKNKVYAYDVNETLIYAFKNVQTNYEKLFIEINNIECEFKKCPADPSGIRDPSSPDEARTSRESYYYYIRKKYNSIDECAKKTITASAMFIFLNKTCFRGMFREGSKGFNVPYGNYKNPNICDYKHLSEIHALIKNVEFICCDFTKSIQNIISDDFVYMDPPYVNCSENSFVQYTSNGFSMENHITLFTLINTMCKNKNVKIMLCNSDVATVRNWFPYPQYNTKTLVCRRCINPKRPDSKTNELIITNYNNEN